MLATLTTAANPTGIVENKWRISGLLRWTGAVFAAVAINLLFFGLLPLLSTPGESSQVAEAPIPQVNVVRVKRPETKAVKKQKPPPPKPQPVKAAKRPAAPAPPKARFSPRMQLSFQVNAKLPARAAELEFTPPPMAPLPVIDTVPDIFDPNALDAPLQVMARTPPVYPHRARRRGLEGWVRVGLVIDTEGRVVEVTVLEAEPAGIFEKSVERCVRTWRFSPGTVDGVAVKSRAETTVRFQLEK